MARPKRFIYDMKPYVGTGDIDFIGMNPKAIGFLQHGQRFDTGNVPDGFVKKLTEWCHPDYTVFPYARRMRCPLCKKAISAEINGETIELGHNEIRVIGDIDIYAGLDLLPHIISEHNYRPPFVFIRAVMESEGPGAAEAMALLNALRR